MTEHQHFTAGQHTRLGSPSPFMPVQWADGGADLVTQPIEFYNDESEGTRVRSLELRDAAVSLKREIPIELKILDDRAVAPSYATDGAAAVDLVYVGDEPLNIWPGETRLIGTGLAIGINDPSIVAKIYPRSSLGNKGLVLGNSTGIIDSDYRGEIRVSLWNRLDASHAPHLIEPGDRIAQMTFERVLHAAFHVVDDLTETTRGAGGFGSTGR